MNTTRLKPVVTKGLFLFGLILVGLFFRIPQIDYGLPAARHPDAIYLTSQASRMSDNWRKGELDLNPGSYYYPGFQITLLALSNLVLPKQLSIPAKSRLFCVVASLATILVGFGCGLLLGGTFIGIGTGVFLTVGYLFVHQGRWPTVDALQLLLLALSLLFLIQPLKKKWLGIVLSGIFAGMAMGTKYTAIIFLFPISVIVLSQPFQFDRNRFFYNVSLWLGALLLGFFLSAPTFFFQFQEFFDHLLLQKEIQAQGSIAFHPPSFLGYIYSLKSDIKEMPFGGDLRGQMGWPFAIMGFIGIVVALKKGISNRNGFLLGLSLSAILSYLFFSLAPKVHNIQYLLPWVFIVCLLVSDFIWDLGQKMSQVGKQKWSISIDKRLMATLLLALVSLPMLNKDLAYLKYLRTPDSRLMAAHWILKNVPPKDKILNLMYGPSLPKNRYEMIQWIFPEYISHLNKGSFAVPSYKRLKKENINWVIWNTYYTNRFFGFQEKYDTHPYFQAWKVFYADLGEKASARHHIPGIMSPNIEIFEIK
ncbi:hypothetical protein BVX98_03830 [bacterium F11]|nr:hypothetical protein BVX98_03830 [bacterium F11]